MKSKNEIKNVQVKVPLKIYKKAVKKLIDDDQSWQSFLLSKIRVYVKKNKLKKR